MDDIEARLNEIARQIEDLVWQHDISYIEASLMLAEQLDIEEEVMGSLINAHQVLRSKVQHEAEKLRFLETEHRLED